MFLYLPSLHHANVNKSHSTSACSIVRMVLYGTTKSFVDSSCKISHSPTLPDFLRHHLVQIFLTLSLSHIDHVGNLVHVCHQIRNFSQSLIALD